MGYLYAFIDESGNDDFGPKGTKHWVVASMVLTDPAAARDSLFELKHELISQGHDIERFHAAEDSQRNRDRVFSILQALGRDQCRVDSVVVRKDRALPTVRTSERLYSEYVELVLERQFARSVLDIRRYDKLLIFLDRPKQRGRAFQSMVSALRKNLPQHLRGVPYELLFHSSASHHGLQMVDYMSWRSS